MNGRRKSKGCLLASAFVWLLLITADSFAGVAALPELERCVGEDGGRVDPKDGGSWGCEGQYYENRHDVETLIDLATLRFAEERSVLAGNQEIYSSLDSLALIRQAIDENPEIARAHIVESDILFWMGLYDDALASLNRAYDLDPYNIGVTIRLAAILFDFGAYEEALFLIADSPHGESDDPKLMSIRAALFREVGEDDEALALYDQLIERGEFSAVAYLHRADVAAQQGAFDDALDEYAEALKYVGPHRENFGLGLGPRGYPALNAVLAEQEASIDELHVLCEAFEESPRSARIAMRIANVLEDYAHGDRELSVRYSLALRNALELASVEDVDIIAAAADGLYEIGQYALAARAYSQAVFLARGRDEGMDGLEELATERLVHSFERLGLGRVAAEYLLSDAELFWYSRPDFDTDIKRSTLQLTFAGPRFENALARFYDYWQGVDLSSLDVTVRTANPCTPEEERFEQVIRGSNVLFGRFTEDYRYVAHRSLRNHVQVAERRRLAGIESKLRSIDSGTDMPPAEIVTAIKSALEAHSVLEIIPLDGVYAVPNLAIGVVNVPYNVPKNQFSGEFDPSYCESVWLTAQVEDCLVRERNTSYLLRAQGVVLNLTVNREQGKGQYSELVEWIDSNRDESDYTMTAHLGGTFTRSSHNGTGEGHGLKEKTDGNMHEFVHDDHALGCDQYNLSALLNGKKLEDYVQEYYDTINLSSLDLSEIPKDRGVAIIDYFPDPSAHTFSYKAKIKDKHFEFGAQFDPNKTQCVLLPKAPQPGDGTSDSSFDDSHGIYVTGILGAQRNSKGLVGLAYDSDIFPYSAKSGQELKAADVVDIIGGLSGQGQKPDVSVLNGSFEFKEPPQGDFVDDFYDSFLTHLDHVLFVFSAGRTSTRTRIGFGCNAYPACFARFPNVMSVAPLMQSGSGELTIREESDYGRGVSIAAPGTNILTTNLDHDFVLQDGSSMAAPFVSGAAVALSSKAPDLKAYEVKQRLMATVKFLGRSNPPADSDRDVLSGVLNVGRAIESIYEDVVVYYKFKEDGSRIDGPLERRGTLTAVSGSSSLVGYARRSVGSGSVQCSEKRLLRLHRNSDGTFSMVCKETYNTDDDTLEDKGVVVHKYKYMNPEVADAEDRPNKCFDYSNDTANCFVLTVRDGDGNIVETHDIDLWKIDDIYFGFDE